MSPRLSNQQLCDVSKWVADYIAEQRETFKKKSAPIPPRFLPELQPFFPSDVLASVQLVQGRAPEPAFYSQLRALGINNAPLFSEMAGITFSDVVVHIEPLTCILLFHELVHAVQYKHLGIEGFAERYVRGFLSGGSYEQIPLEKQAYALEAKFASHPHQTFSVEEDVLKKVRLGQL